MNLDTVMWEEVLFIFSLMIPRPLRFGEDAIERFVSSALVHGLLAAGKGWSSFGLRSREWEFSWW